MLKTLSQNGVAERYNRSLKDIVKSMINHTSLPYLLYIEALKTIVHIFNRVSSKIVYKAPYELWTSKMSSIKHLNIWSCQIEVRLYRSNERKLD